MSEPFWVPLGGAGVDYKSDWAAGTQYQSGDVVRYGGVDYLAVNPSLGSTPPMSSGPAGVPTGAIMEFAGNAAPTGWLLCDGTAVSRTTYAALFAVMGTAYGVGDGSTTFNVPDMRGRVAVGRGAAGAVDALGDNDGVTLANRRPQHRHTPHTHNITDPDTNPFYRGGGASSGNSGVATNNALLTHQLRTVSVDGGSGVGGDTLDAPAYLVVNHLVKT